MKHEYQPREALDHGLVAAYSATFIPRFDVYPIQLPNGTYVSVKKHLNMQIIEAHLKGAITIGAYALDENSNAKWICCDADTDKDWEGLVDLACDLRDERVQGYLEPSRRGGHLWLFLESMPGRDARRFGRQLLRLHEFSTVELYPKQDELKTGPGSLVRLPLGCHKRSKRRYHFVTIEGMPIAETVRAQMGLLAAPERVPQQFITQILRHADEAEVEEQRLAPLPSSELIAGKTPSERIKERICVHDFVQQYVELDKQGRGYCPFHDDLHKSFSINLRGNYWHCFAGCGGGSVIDFWSQWRHTRGEDASFVATITELAEMLL